MMSCRASGSVPFLLVAFVSLIAQSTTYVQELRIDIIPDDADSSQHDTDDEVWPPPPPPHPEPARHRRMPPSSIDKGAIIDILNRLRRSHGAPDMYYVVRCVSVLFVNSNLFARCNVTFLIQI